MRPPLMNRRSRRRLRDKLALQAEALLTKADAQLCAKRQTADKPRLTGTLTPRYA